MEEIRERSSVICDGWDINNNPFSL